MEPVRPTPWGFEELLWQGTAVTAKILHVNPGARLSLQRHRRRDEEWTVLSQGSSVQIGDTTVALRHGEKISIPRGTKHRLAAGPDEKAVVLEISRGEFDQDDIERFEDDYGRC